MCMFFESNEYIDHQRTTQSPIIKSTRKIATRMHTKIVLDYESRRVSVFFRKVGPEKTSDWGR